MTTFSGPIHGFFHQIYIINYVPPRTKPICMGFMIVSRKVCRLIDKTFVMGHQLPILEWFLDLKTSMIIVGFNSSGTFPISLMVLYVFIHMFKKVILKNSIGMPSRLGALPFGRHLMAF